MSIDEVELRAIIYEYRDNEELKKVTINGIPKAIAKRTALQKLGQLNILYIVLVLRSQCQVPYSHLNWFLFVKVARKVSRNVWSHRTRPERESHMRSYTNISCGVGDPQADVVQIIESQRRNEGCEPCSIKSS